MNTEEDLAAQTWGRGMVVREGLLENITCKLRSEVGDLWFLVQNVGNLEVFIPS